MKDTGTPEVSEVQEDPIATRSTLRPAYVEKQLSARYDVGSWIECRYWLRGLNDTYRVRTTSGTYMLRVYRVEVREDAATFELNLLERLQAELQGSAAVASPAVRLADGRLFSALPAPEGTRFAAMFREAEGAEDPLHDEAACRAFGCSAAELHAAMDRLAPGIEAADFAAMPGMPRAPQGAGHGDADEVASWERLRAAADAEALLRRPLRMILAHIGEDHSQAGFLRGYAQELEAAAAHAAASGLDFGLCHGDMHGNNNALRQGARFTHFDFEFAAPPGARGIWHR